MQKEKAKSAEEIKATIKEACLLSLSALQRTCSLKSVSDTPENAYTFLQHLHAISVIQSAEVLYPKQETYNILEKVDEISDLTFKHESVSFVVYNEQSMTAYNALYAIILFKCKRNEEAVRFSENVLRCVKKEGVLPLYDPNISSEPDYNNFHLSRVLLCLLLSYQHTEDELYFQSASHVGSICLQYGIRHDPFEIWALALLFEHKEDLECADPDNAILINRIFDTVDSIRQMTVLSMTSLFAAVAQQTYVAFGQPNERLLDYQLSLQITSEHNFGYDKDYYGLFVKSMRTQSTRADYTTHNMLSFLQYEFSQKQADQDLKDFSALVI